MNWPDLFKIFDIKPRFSFGVWLFGLVLIVLPQSTLPYLGIDQILGNIRPWVSLLTIAFFILWLVQLSPWNLITNIYTERRLRKDLANTIENLSDDERILVAYCIHEKAQTIHLNIGHPTASALRAKGFIRILPGMSSPKAVPYYFPQQIFRLLTDNRYLIFPEAVWKTPELKKLFEQVDQQLHENARRANF